MWEKTNTFDISVSNGNNIVPCNSSSVPPMTSKADKLPLETDSVARDNNTGWKLKVGTYEGD